MDAGELNEWTEVWSRSERHDRHLPADRRHSRATDRDATDVPDNPSVSVSGFGIMKFGSRIDLFLPLSATIAAKVGDRVVGGQTTLATLATADARRGTAAAAAAS